METQDRRKSRRIEASLKAKIVSLSNINISHDVEITNMGGGGFSFTCNSVLKEGEKFTVHLPDISVQFYIIWHQDNKYGAMFTNPMGNELEVIASTIYK